MNKFVKLLNLLTGITSSVPAAELAPGYIVALSPVTGEPVYVEQARLGISATLLFASIPAEAQKALKYYCDAVADVDPLSTSDHEFLLRCNQHPVRELSILCHIASVYKHFTANKVVSRCARMELFLLLHQCSLAERETAPQIHANGTLQRHTVQQVVNEYYNTDPWVAFERRFSVANMDFLPIK